MGLWDAAMIKDNHVAVAGGVAEAVRRAKDHGVERIILEVDRLSQIEARLRAQYSALDKTMSKANALSQYVTQQITTWNKSSA